MKEESKMDKYAIETNLLTKKYRHTTAVDQISLQIVQGEIFGLIGENGAGKSTLMKMLSGMVNSTSGDFKIFGHKPSEDKYLYRRMGVLIEEAGLLGSMTAFDNMKTKALALGFNDDKRLCELLELCDIAHTGKKKVKTFSMGMKQRLAIAMTLIQDPDLLILDEPTNGIDPKGFESIRKLLIRLNKEERKTILISSHILEELNKVATSYGIMKKGKLIECVTNEELNQRCRQYLQIKVDSSSKASMLLEQMLSIYSYAVIDKNTIHIFDEVSSDKIIKMLVMNDIAVYSCMLNSQSLEEYFLSRNGGIE